MGFVFRNGNKKIYMNPIFFVMGAGFFSFRVKPVLCDLPREK